jgi:hypothetical protein
MTPNLELFVGGASYAHARQSPATIGFMRALSCRKAVACGSAQNLRKERVHNTPILYEVEYVVDGARLRPVPISRPSRARQRIYAEGLSWCSPGLIEDVPRSP